MKLDVDLIELHKVASKMIDMPVPSVEGAEKARRDAASDGPSPGLISGLARLLWWVNVIAGGVIYAEIRYWIPAIRIPKQKRTRLSAQVA